MTTEEVQRRVIDFSRPGNTTTRRQSSVRSYSTSRSIRLSACCSRRADPRIMAAAEPHYHAPAVLANGVEVTGAGIAAIGY